MTVKRLQLLSLLSATLFASGCASAVHWTPPATSPQPVVSSSIQQHPAERVVATASRQVGAPYRYGGASPRGFDCSGLVFFSYGRAGIRVPRTTRDLYRHAQPIAVNDLRPGDLLFFYFENKVGHVAIYAGDNQFIHAPSSGKHVMLGTLDDQFWRERLVSAGRLL